MFCLEDSRNTIVYVFITEIICLTFDVIIDVVERLAYNEYIFTKLWWRTIQIKDILSDNLLGVASLFSYFNPENIHFLKKYLEIHYRNDFFQSCLFLLFFLETHSKECRFALLVRFFWSGHPGKQQLQKGKKPRPSRFHKMFTNWQNTCT